MKRTLIFIIISITASIAVAKPPHLDVEKFFDGTYNKDKSVSISISKSQTRYSYMLTVRNNESLVNKIIESYEKDLDRAEESSLMISRGNPMASMKILNNDRKIEIGYMCSNDNSCTLFIKGPADAFK